MIRTVYFISGLGADEQVFRNLDVNCREKIYVKWIVPGPEESFENYLSRLEEQIIDRENFALVGVSFGGMVAGALAKRLKPAATIIISSVKQSRELPPVFRLLAATGLAKRFPFGLLPRFPFLAYFFFGAADGEERSMIYELLRDEDERIVKWSANQVLNWRNDRVADNLYHIHGTRDRVFPFRRILEPLAVPGGTHFMVLTKAAEVSTLINKCLEKL